MSFVKENLKLSEDIDDVNESQLESKRGMSFWKLLRFLIANKQFVAVIISVFLGFLIGIVLHDAVQKSDEPEKMVMYIKFPGELFIRMLRMIIIPLTISTIVVALAETDTGKAKKLGKYTFLYYLTTTIFATVLGITLIMIIKPGKDHTAKRDEEFNESSPISALDSFLDLLRNLIPKNLMEATLKSTQSNFAKKSINFRKENISIPESAEDAADLLGKNIVLPWSANRKNITIIKHAKSYKFSGTIDKDGTNFMGLIIFSILLGVVLRKLGDDGRPLLEFCRAWLHVIMMLVSWIMWISPIGILSLIAGSLTEVEDIVQTFKNVGLFVTVNFVGCFIQAFIVYPSLYFFFVRKNPLKYLGGIVPAMITAFGTSSSSATLPVTIRCVTENNKVDRKVAQFCLPIGATCNMDGSALYFATVVIFLANLEKINLSFGEVVLTALIAMFVSAGASGIPSAGLSYTILCLEAVGIPTRYIGLIFAIDWFIDRIQTVNNVMGDAYGAGILNQVTDMTDQENNVEKSNSKLNVIFNAHAAEEKNNQHV